MSAFCFQRSPFSSPGAPGPGAPWSRSRSPTASSATTSRRTKPSFSCWAPAYNRAFGAFPAAVSGAVSGDRIHKAAEVIAMPDAIAMYGRMVSNWIRPADAVLGGREPPVLLTSYDWQRHGLRDFTSRMMYLDSVSYLPSDILVKVDRASMAVSLEARCPLLDHRVVEFAWRMPLGQKLRDGKGKWLLRRVLERCVPSTMFDRPKQGFGIPVNEWLRGPLRDWADDLLAESRLRRDGIFRPGVVRRRWEQQRAGTHSNGYAMWNVLMFQAWHDRWAGSLATEPDLALAHVAG